MLIKMLDKIITHLDNKQSLPAVIGTMLDWSATFDRQCPNIAIQKFSTIGVRASINELLASYLQDRYMMAKFNGILLLPTTCLEEVPKEPCWESLNIWSSAMIMLIVCNQT